MADRFNDGKPKLSLVPPEFLLALVSAFGEGEVKYGRNNWRSGAGLVWSEVYDSAQRHQLAWLGGEDIDPTSGTSHLSKAAWNMLVLEYYRRHPSLFGGMDDRYKTLEGIAYDIRNEQIADAAFGIPENGPGGHPGLRPVWHEGANVFGGTPVVDLPGMSEGAGGDGNDRSGPEGGADQNCGEAQGGNGADYCQPHANLLGLRGCARCAGATVLEELQAEIATWADSVFPDRTAHGALTKLMLHEIPELITSKLLDPTEYADIVILVLDIAHLNGIDISCAVREKMAINRARSWKIDVGTGLMSHVKEEATAAGGDHFFMAADPKKDISGSSDKWHATACTDFHPTTDRDPDIFYSRCIICSNQNSLGGMCESELKRRGLTHPAPVNKWGYVRCAESEWGCENYFGWAGEGEISTCTNCEGRSGGCPDGLDADPVYDAYTESRDLIWDQIQTERLNHTTSSLCPMFVNITPYDAGIFANPCVICKHQPGPDGVECGYKITEEN